MFQFKNRSALPTVEEAPPGRDTAMAVSGRHFVSGNPMVPPFPAGIEMALFGLGCFWGAERAFWQTNGVFSTAVGYSDGLTPNPIYDELCSGKTGHAEVVRIMFEPEIITYDALLKQFWEAHNPTQGMRQGNDHGTQYRSAIYAYDDVQQQQAEASRDRYQLALQKAGYGAITTEIKPAAEFYYAEEYHQQYLAKNPGGYCGLGGLEVRL